MINLIPISITIEIMQWARVLLCMPLRLWSAHPGQPQVQVWVWVLVWGVGLGKLRWFPDKNLGERLG
jgi:hypothetical protein